MSLWLLFIDEMKSFYKSKVMIVLWIGFPVISILLHYFQVGSEEMPVFALVGLIIASLGGTLATVILSTSIVGEKKEHVYELFLIRPVKRRNILLSKFFAVYSCLIVATVVALIFGFVIDVITSNIALSVMIKDTLKSVAISIAAMSISCSIGILIGTLSSSIALAAILSIYIGNQLSLISIMPSIFFPELDPLVFSIIVGVVATCLIWTLIILIFRRKQF
ncbi:MAG: ABC transporter permease [Candidatus Helarchaeota archaeon]